MIAHAVSVEPVKQTPATRGSLVMPQQTVAPSPQELQHFFSRHAGFMHQLHREKRIKLVCSAALRSRYSGGHAAAT